jgi:hypothetical protein
MHTKHKALEKTNPIALPSVIAMSQAKKQSQPQRYPVPQSEKTNPISPPAPRNRYGLSAKDYLLSEKTKPILTNP